MAQVNNATAQKRWESLKGSAGVSISRIVQGNATSSDYQRVQNVLTQQSNLASQVFSTLLATAKVNAEKSKDNFSDILDKNNKVILSSFEAAFNAEIKKLSPDIVGQLKELIEMSILQSNEDIGKQMGSQFDSIRHLLPEKKDTPSVNDLLAANELLAEHLIANDKESWEKREPELLERIAQTFEGTLRDLAQKINAERAHRNRTARGHANSQPGGLIPRLAGPRAPAAMERPSLLAQGLALLRGGGVAPESNRAPSDGVSGSSDTSTTVVSISPATDRELTTDAKAQKGFYDKIKDLLPDLGKKDKGDAQKKDDEADKADTWWRSFKNWFGDDDKKKSNKKKDKYGWLKGLGTMLALMILNPKLFQTLGEGIKNLLTWDNIKGAAEKSWDWVKGASSTVLTAIQNLLAPKTDTVSQDAVDEAHKGGGGKAELSQSSKTRVLTPEQKAQLAEFDKGAGPGVDKNPNAKLPPAPPGGHSSWQSKVANLFGFKLGAETVNVAGTNISQSSVANTAINSAGTGRSSVVNKPPLPANMPTGAAASTTYSETPSIPMTPGVALPTVDATHAMVGSGSTQPQKGAPQIGIGSFGFQAANSDSLVLMNTYHFTAGH